MMLEGIALRHMFCSITPPKDKSAETGTMLLFISFATAKLPNELNYASVFAYVLHIISKCGHLNATADQSNLDISIVS